MMNFKIEEIGHMMMNEFGHRRGYDDRSESSDWWVRQGQGQGRSFEPRHEAHLRRYDGDWMRQSPWMGESQWVRQEPGYEPMVKVIEVFAESPHSWEDATRRAVAEASQNIRGIRSIYIKDMQAVVDDDRVVRFRINAKISFTLDDSGRRR